MTCKHFGECGSCRNYEGGSQEQLKQKTERIGKDFSPFYTGEIDVFASPDKHYRARAEFKIWHVEDEIHYAMNHIEGRGVVLLEECPKVIEPIAVLMPKLLEAIKEADIDRKLFGVDFLSTSDGEIAVSMLYHRKLDSEWEAKAKALSEKLGIHIIGRSRKQKVVIGQDYVTETLDIAGKSYRFEQIENSFTQPNPRVNEQMVGWALKRFEGLSGDLLELYCGAGNFTIPFASRFEKVLATEISKSSINAAKNNMKLNGVGNIDFVRMSAEEFVQALDGVREFTRMKDIDLESYELKTIFVDPPRSGMDEKSCDFAARFESLLYISCNPDTLKRDLEHLCKTHKVDAMAVFDQFPYTNHLEMGVKLTKKEAV
ncbi:MAG: tRNA (uridine(54)-C5)-methyltransferase TrmA [Sulfurimonadaceae bacterium]|nr:tRNA (uridine(54)-C5)-methyltransferase TrmA [Sulfurimonadaceae bacterium]